MPRTLYQQHQPISNLAVGDAWIVFDASGAVRLDLMTGRLERFTEERLHAPRVEGATLLAVVDGGVLEAKFPPIGRVASRWLTADPAARAREFAVGDHVVWFTTGRVDYHAPELRFTPL